MSRTSHRVCTVMSRAYVCSHASKEAQQKALLSMLVHFDLVETEMVTFYAARISAHSLREDAEAGHDSALIQ